MFDDLLDACRRDDLKRIQALVAADPTLLTRHAASGETPLLTARYHRGRAVAEWLRGANPSPVFRNVMANTPLHAALAARSLAAANLPPEAGAGHRTACAGYTPLSIAEGSGFSAGAEPVSAMIDARGGA